jgi:hypothetical protein
LGLGVDNKDNQYRIVDYSIIYSPKYVFRKFLIYVFRTFQFLVSGQIRGFELALKRETGAIGFIGRDNNSEEKLRYQQFSIRSLFCNNTVILVSKA